MRGGLALGAVWAMLAVEAVTDLLEGLVDTQVTSSYPIVESLQNISNQDFWEDQLSPQDSSAGFLLPTVEQAIHQL